MLVHMTKNLKCSNVPRPFLSQWVGSGDETMYKEAQGLIHHRLWIVVVAVLAWCRRVNFVWLKLDGCSLVIASDQDQYYSQD